MTVSELKKTQCSGCGACMNICPRNAIMMGADDEGFYIPVIDEKKCIDCGKCYSLCPAQKDHKVTEPKKGYLVRLKNDIILKNSASGGAFSGIADYMLRKYNAVIAGVAVMDDLFVRHIVIKSGEDLKKLQNSKYVQSYTGNVYLKVKEALANGYTVLFSGTPCQIAGLYSVVPEGMRESLYTIDLVCHGVPSPSLLKRELEMDSKSKQGRVIDFRFRYKNPHANSNSSYMMMMMMERGRPIVRKTSQDVYFKLFMQGMDFRESCYYCKYANLYRIGDITVGDCDSQEFYSKFHPEESNSILLVNSSKGERIWEEVSGLFESTDLDVRREAEYNHQLAHPFERPEQRDGIYNELLNEDWSKITHKYALPQSKIERYKLLFILNIPGWVKKILSKIWR